MHTEQVEFCDKIKRLYPEKFKGNVLDIGSLDINGNNRYLFPGCNYVGCDLQAGNNVTIIKPAYQLTFADEYFDVIISTEALEHDKYYELTICNAIRMLKKGGLMLFTCATTGRPEHGTFKTDVGSSPFTLDYYKNLTEKDLRPFFKDFDKAEFEVNLQHFDLYFYGIK